MTKLKVISLRKPSPRYPLTRRLLSIAEVVVVLRMLLDDWLQMAISV